MGSQENKDTNLAPTTNDGLEYILKFIKDANLIGSSLCLFRGHKNYDWHLVSTSHRKINNNGNPENISEEIIQNNLELINEYKLKGYRSADTVEMAESDLMILAKLRHQGADNLLLDFSANVLIALWFACAEHEEFEEVDRNTKGTKKYKKNKKDGAVFILSVDDAGKYLPMNNFDRVKNFSLEESLKQDMTYYWKATLINTRIIAQKSYFVMSRDVKYDKKILVPASQKKAIRSALDKFMGINEISLFPDEAGFSQAYSDALSHTETETGHGNMAVSYFFERDKIRSNQLVIRKSLYHYSAVIKLNPENYTAYNNRGLAYDEISEYKKAIGDFDEAIKLNNNYAEAYYNRGGVKYKIGDLEEAVKDYDTAIKLGIENVS